MAVAWSGDRELLTGTWLLAARYLRCDPMIGVAFPIEGEAVRSLAGVERALKNVVEFRPGGIPHVSLHGAEEYEIDYADVALQSLARSQAPFSVFVAGFGLFSRPAPIIHLAVVRSSRLNALHRVVAQEVGRFATGVDPNFRPDRWVPHITITRDPVSPSQVAAAAQLLVEVDLAFEVPITALALVEDTGEGQRVLHRHSLSG